MVRMCPHFVCIFLKSGMHLTLRIIFEIFISCIDLISLNWLYNWPNTYTTLPKVLGYPLLMKGLTTLVIPMSTNLNV